MRALGYIAVFLLAAVAGCNRVGSPELYLRLDHDIDSAKSKMGDRVASRLESPVVVDGRDVLPKGTKFELRVTNSQVAREKGSVGLLTLEVDSFSLTDTNMR
jgi:hypothetical protein